MAAGPVRPSWPAQASTRDQNPSSYTSGLQSAEICLAASAVSMATPGAPSTDRTDLSPQPALRSELLTHVLLSAAVLSVIF